MALLSDVALDDVRARNPVDQVASRFVTLRRSGRKLVGPCPICSPNPASRTAGRFEVDGETWVCAVCSDGGDVIRLVQRVQGLDFRAAVAWLGGAQEIDPEEARRREAERARKRAAQEWASAHYREEERRRIWQMWQAGRPIAGTAVEAYLAQRGLPLPPPGAALRFAGDVPYYETGAADARVIHRGPAMLAAIVAPDGRFSGLHTTWLDLAPPNGKALIVSPRTGEVLPAKKVRGTKLCGRIELVRCREPRRLVIGEGIETVLSVWTALARAGRDLGATAFWSSIDLGNLGGRATETVPHPTLLNERGRPQRVPGPVPDMAVPGIPVPDSVTDIVLLGDGDSDRVLTDNALKRAAARWARPGRVIRAAWAPEGRDFNDLIKGEA